MKKILVALLLMIWMVVPGAVYASVEDATNEEMTVPANGDVDNTSVSGVVFQYYSDVQQERTSKEAVKRDKDGIETNYYEAPVTPDGYENYIFAGWYTDESGSVDAKNPLTETELENENVKAAWAKFVPKNILSVKAQVLGGTNYTKESTSIRFVTSVDTLNYRKVGFDFVIFNKSNIKFGRETNTVYERLYGVGSENVVLNYTPNYVFNSISEYFMAFTFSGVTNKDFAHGISANPYWITLDGTLVYGEKDTKTVNEAYMKWVTDVTAAKMSEMALPSFSAFPTLSSIGAQGGCFDGEYYYQAIVGRNYVNGEYSDEKTIIQKYQLSGDGNSWSIVNASECLQLCHANDLTYNRNLSYTNADGKKIEGLLIVCHNLGGRNKISFIDPVSLVVVDPAAIGFETIADAITVDSANKCIEIAYQIWSIDYNNFSDRYVVGISGGQTFRVLDANFKDVGGKVYPATSQTVNWTTQGVASDDSYIYFVLYRVPANGNNDDFNPAYDGHVITVYDWDGNFVTLAEIDTDSIGVEIEPENISVYNNTMYIVGRGNKTNIYKVSDLILSQEPVAYIDENEYYFTLEDAVMNAAEGDTITLIKDVTVNFSMPIYTDNITVTNNTDTSKGDTDITITRGTKLNGAMFDNYATGFGIKGNASGTLSINGAGVSGSSLIVNQTAASMTMEKLSVSNAKGNSFGGVLYSYGELNVIDLEFKSNSATTGGAIYLASGEATIKNSNFEGNSATASAGAIRTEANKDIILMLLNNTFKGNQAGTNGGAVNHNGGKLNLTDCIFKDNSTTGGTGGGALAVNDGSEAMLIWTKTASEEIGFSGNSAPNGGAVYCNNATVTIDGYCMDGNTAKTNGGALSFGTTAKVGIQNAKLSNNIAGAKAGAIYTNSLNLTLDAVEFNGNKATSNGGAIQAESGAVIDITGAAFTANTAYSGGAVYLASGKATIKNSNFEGNSATASAGAIRTEANKDIILTLSNNTFKGNQAGTNGGAVNHNGGKLNLTDCIFKDNSTTGGTGGGALAVNDGSEATLTWTKTDSKEIGFSGNSAPNGGVMYCNNATVTIDGYCMDGNTSKTDGGALHLGATAKVGIQNAKMSNNTAGSKGGAISTSSSNLTVTDCVFMSNKSSSHGGAIYMANGTLKLNSTTEAYTDSKFEGNASGTAKSGDGKGGAIYVLKGTCHVGYDGDDAATEYGYAFHNNNSNYHGGAINLEASAVVVINKSEFTQNTSGNGKNGGAINSYSHNLTVTNTRFENNSTSTTGGAGGALIANGSKNTSLVDCTFIGNTAWAGNENGGAVKAEGAVMTLSRCTFEANVSKSTKLGGGAIFVKNSTVTVTDSKFARNIIQDEALGGTAIFIQNSGTSSVYVKGNSIFSDNGRTDIYKANSQYTLEVDQSITYTTNE